MFDRIKLDELNIQIRVLKDNIDRTTSEKLRTMYRAALVQVEAKQAEIVEGCFRG